MSAANDTASPAGSTPGAGAGATPTNGAKPPPVWRRRKPAADPLIRKKPTPQSSKPVARNRQNGLEAIPSLKNHTIIHGNEQDNSGHTGPFEEFKIVTTKRALRDDLRYHVMRLLPALNDQIKAYDPRDKAVFVPPVKLHRRDPRANPFGPGMLIKEEEQKSDVNPADEKEREKREAMKKEKQAIREAFQAQTAPVAKNPVKKDTHQKKTEQFFKAGDMSLTAANKEIKYEESIPWHLEDFDNTQTWSGTYEASLSRKHIMLLRDPNGSNILRMVPVEKWYKFRPKDRFQALTYEEAEARLSKKIKDPRWFMESKKEHAETRKQQILEQRRGALAARRGERGERNVKDEDWEGPEISADIDDIDYDYDEAFADDEENPLYGEAEDEDAKNAEDKVKREQREANVFDIKEEKDYDAEEVTEKQKAEDSRKLSKRVQKALMKREKNFMYESDSDRDKFSGEESQAESEDSEAEMVRQEEERRKKEEAEKAEAANNSSSNTKTTKPDAKTNSGTSTKGTNTPQARPSALSKSSLKRPGSPLLSEASGNESSRKKIKKRHELTGASGVVSRTASRATSPSALAPSARGGHASSSDGETDTARRPNGSKRKPGSPRPGSPKQPLTGEELRAAIPPQGLSLTEFMKTYLKRSKNRDQLVVLMKQNAQFVKENRTLYPIGAKLPEEVLEMKRAARKEAKSKEAKPDKEAEAEVKAEAE